MDWLGFIPLMLLFVLPETHGEVTGRSFVIAFLNNPGKTDPKLTISTTGFRPVDVNVSTPADKSAPLLHELTVDGTETINVPFSLRMDTSGSNDKAILVDSAGPISVVAANGEGQSSDEFLVFPTERLGRRYTILSLSGEQYQSEFAVVAVHNNTGINISFPDGSSFSTVLGPYESYMYVQDSTDTELTGTEVVATMPVAVFVGANKVSKRALSGHLAEQLIPVRSWGRTFLVSPLSSNGDLLRIVAHGEPVAVRIRRNSSVEYEFHIVHPREFVSLDIGASGDEHFLVESNDTVLLGQFSKVSTFPQASARYVFTQVPAVEQYTSSYTVPVAGFSEQSVSISAISDVYMEIMINDKLADIPFQSVFVNKHVATMRGFESATYTGPGGYGMILHSLSDIPFNRLVNLELLSQPQGCEQTVNVLSDAFDNDCDGKFDEEWPDQLDNDGDQKVDEDTKPLEPTPSYSDDSTVLAESTLQPSYTTGMSVETTATQGVPGNINDGSMTSSVVASNENGGFITSSAMTRNENGGYMISSMMAGNEGGDYMTSTMIAEGKDVSPTTSSMTEQMHSTQITYGQNGNGEVDKETPASTTSKPDMDKTDVGDKTTTESPGSTNGGAGTNAANTTQLDGKANATNKMDPYVSKTPEANKPTTKAAGNDVVTSTQKNDKTTKQEEQSDHNSHIPTREAPKQTNQEKTTKPSTTKETIGGHDVITTKTTLSPEQEGTQTTKKTVTSRTEEDTTKSGVTELVSDTTTPSDAIQSAINKESADDMGILTILAPSFICGVPLLIVVMCCLRSVIAGSCRKKVVPNEKKNAGPTYPHLWGKPPPNF